MGASIKLYPTILFLLCSLVPIIITHVSYTNFKYIVRYERGEELPKDN